MSTKSPLPNQHDLLHPFYGADNCCLCRTEREIAELRARLDDIGHPATVRENIAARLRRQASAMRAAEAHDWIDGRPIPHSPYSLGRIHAYEQIARELERTK